MLSITSKRSEICSFVFQNFKMDLSIDQPIGDLSILLADVDYKKENELLKLELSQTRENADRLKEQLTKKLQMESKIQEAVVKADKSIRQNTEV